MHVEVALLKEKDYNTTQWKLNYSTINSLNMGRFVILINLKFQTPSFKGEKSKLLNSKSRLCLQKL